LQQFIIFFFLPKIAYLLLLPLLTALDPAAAHAAESGDFAGLVDIGGGRKMYLECRGTGSPTVMLVAGLRGSAEDWSIADKSTSAVFPEVAKFTRVRAYDRPGTTDFGGRPNVRVPGDDEVVQSDSGLLRRRAGCGRAPSLPAPLNARAQPGFTSLDA